MGETEVQLAGAPAGVEPELGKVIKADFLEGAGARTKGR